MRCRQNARIGKIRVPPDGKNGLFVIQDLEGDSCMKSMRCRSCGGSQISFPSAPISCHLPGVEVKHWLMVFDELGGRIWNCNHSKVISTHRTGTHP